MLRLVLKNWREGAIGGLVVVTLFLLLQWKKADANLKAAKLAYENPQVREVVREVKVQGPVKIVYRRTREPLYGEHLDGMDELAEKTAKEVDAKYKETIEKIIYRDTVTTEKERGRQSQPVPCKDILAVERSDRWLLSLGVNKLSVDTEGKGLLVGYGFRNRLDITAGVIRTDRSTGWVFATMRF